MDMPRLRVLHHLALSYLASSMGRNSRAISSFILRLPVLWPRSRMANIGRGGRGRKDAIIHAREQFRKVHNSEGRKGQDGCNIPKGKINPVINITSCRFLFPNIPLSVEKLILGAPSQTVMRFEVALRSIPKCGDQILELLKRDLYGP